MEFKIDVHLYGSMFSIRRKKYDHFTDEALLEHYKSTSEKAYVGEIYKRYGHLVMGVALKYLKESEIAEDLTMNLFEKLFSNLQKHDIVNFKSWLFMVTRNDCLMYLRKLKRTVPIELEAIAAENESENLLKLESKELNILLLEKNLEGLKSEQQKCINLFYIKELSYQEISIQLNISVKQVKSAIQNGKRNLKLLLEKEDEFNQEI